MEIHGGRSNFIIVCEIMFYLDLSISKYRFVVRSFARFYRPARAIWRSILVNTDFGEVARAFLPLSARSL